MCIAKNVACKNIAHELLMGVDDDAPAMDVIKFIDLIRIKCDK